MVPITEIRRIEVLVDGIWTPAQMAQLTEGDIVRQYEPDGCPVLMHSHHTMTVMERPAFTAEPYTQEVQK